MWNNPDNIACAIMDSAFAHFRETIYAPAVKMQITSKEFQEFMPRLEEAFYQKVKFKIDDLDTERAAT